jgi:DNA-binding NarL/FixJ family response regulator
MLATHRQFVRPRLRQPAGRSSQVVVYTWNFHPALIASARQQGALGYLSKLCSRVISSPRWKPFTQVSWSSAIRRLGRAARLAWTGLVEATAELTDRESEILALITQGKGNAEVASLTYLGPNTVKSYIRAIYGKIDVASRSQAVLWGIEHGFTPDRNRIERWRDGPGRS